MIRRRLLRFALTEGLMTLCVAVSLAQGTLRLTVYPNALVADGISTALVTAEVRTPQGKPVPDGTQVAFSTTLGAFREALVATEGGVARATFVAASVPGVAVITASALGQSAVGEAQVVMVRSPEDLRAATDYVQVFGTEYLAFANEQRIIAASGANFGASVRFGLTTLEADDLQLETDSLRVKARHARLRFGSEAATYNELVYDLRTGEGYGVTEHEGRWQVFRIRSGLRTPFPEPLPPDWFQFADLSYSEMVIRARQIWFYPGERLQFRQAEFYVGDVRVLSLPLYSHSVWGSGVGADTFFGVQNGQVYLDIPYYYALAPGQVGALRLRTAQRASRGTGISRGLFLDLEHEYRWGQGQGAFTFTGLGRDDWGVLWRHSQPLGTRTRMHLWLDSPAHQGLYTSAQVSHQGRGFSLGATVAGSTFWEGSDARSLRTDLFAESTPRKIANLPLRQSLALTFSSATTRTTQIQQRREGFGIRARWNLIPQSLDRQTTLTGGFVAGRYLGNLPNAGWSFTGTLGITRALGRTGALTLTYDYNEDALGVSLLGRHRLSGSLSWNPSEHLTLAGYFSRALDTDTFSYLADASWRISGLWRIGSGITWQAFQGNTFRDHTFTIAYRIGFREVALTWSSNTKRWSFDILTAFY
ncbi:hypothetical protein HRbin14_00889 [bacterium HR14]|nr:hypothetical protein HRbin14_00889 [bacterium HR14]